MRVIIMSGIPGSGKSTYAAKQFPSSIVCSNDEFMQTPEGYKWSPEILQVAKGKCLKKFIKEIAYSQSRFDAGDVTFPIVVDNVNSSVLAIAPYYEIASAYDAIIQIVTVWCDYPVASHRNYHGVSLEHCRQAYNKLGERRLPSFWKYTPVNVDFMGRVLDAPIAAR